MLQNNLSQKISKPKTLPFIIIFIALIALLIWKKDQLARIPTFNKIISLFKKPEPVSDLQTITNPQAIFPSEVVSIRDRTEIKLTYKQASQSGIIILNLQLDASGSGRNFTVSDPLLNNLNWNYVESPEFSLFQKEKQYDSVDQFLAAPPQLSKVLIDSYVENTNSSFFAAKQYYQVEDMQAYDFILSSYHRSYAEGDRLVWQIITNTNDAFVKDNEIFWLLSMPEVNQDNPIDLKIDINYAQPGNMVPSTELN